MGSRDERVDAYIARAQPFARPILTRLRALVHEGCPTVEETMKWGLPHFQYEGMLCMMAAFKAHATFGFWHGEHLLGASSRNAEAMGDFGRITSVDDLPAKGRIVALVRAAMKLNERGVKRTPRDRDRVDGRGEAAELEVHAALTVAPRPLGHSMAGRPAPPEPAL
jgi:hypothetical protein